WAMDWARLREICDTVGAVLLADIAHPAGLIVAGLIPSPIGYADAITTTTHKTLCGPRGAMVLSTNHDHADKIDMAVFPGEQGGPHLNQIAAKAVCFMLDNTDAYRSLMGVVKANCAALGEALKEQGLEMVYGGTETHLLLVDLRKIKSPTGYPITGEVASRILDLVGITCNKNTIAGDTNAAHPGAIRLGTTWISQRGLRPEHMPALAGIIARAIKNIHPFRYLESKGAVGRGKIEFSLLETLKDEVDCLVQKSSAEIEVEKPSCYPFFSRTHLGGDSYDAEKGMFHIRGYELPEHYGDKSSEISHSKKGCAIVETPQHGILRISGERARAALQDLCTADILSLSPWEVQRTFLLDPDGKVIDDVDILRLDSEGDVDRYLLVTRGSRFETLKNWLRANSDCYVVTDRVDYFAKVQGPFLVEDLSCPHGEGLTSLSLFGHKAVELIGKFDPIWKSLSNCKGAQNSEGIIAMRCSFDCTSKENTRVILLGVTEAMHRLEDRLVSAGAIRCGVGVMAEERRAAGLPVYLADGNDFKGADLVAKQPEMFSLSKPFFVGWRNLPSLAAAKDAVAFEWKPAEEQPRKSVLYEEHLKLKGKMVPFAGWTMPVWYTSTADEHAACRVAAGLFDVSHMGVMDFIGANVIRFLDTITSNYVHWLRDGQGHYSYLLGPDGVPIDDILVYRVNRTHFMMVVNAANADKDEAWLRGVNEGRYIIDAKHPGKRCEAKVTIRNLKKLDEAGSDSRVDIAFQGPKSLETLLGMADGIEFKKEIYRLKRFCICRGKLAGMDAIVARTGYTGENIGFEIYVHPDNAVTLWRTILEQGKPLGAKPVGLGARDSLRTEAGLPLYGHELAGHFGVLPIEAGYGFAVRLHKPFFIGRDAMLENEKGRTREIVRFRVTSKGARMLANSDPVFDARGGMIGYVTSNVAVEGVQHGLAYLPIKYAKEGTPIFCYAMSNAQAPAKKITEMVPGDKSILPIEAEVISRFMKKEGASEFPIIVDWSKYVK
ncbi:MAG: glycine cleavage system aminomethyltransferase GcvT, partial [Candidatus Brocadiia bacterium]